MVVESCSELTDATESVACESGFDLKRHFAETQIQFGIRFPTGSDYYVQRAACEKERTNENVIEQNQTPAVNTATSQGSLFRAGSDLPDGSDDIRGHVR